MMNTATNKILSKLSQVSPRKPLLAALVLALLPACGAVWVYDDVTPLDQDGDGLLDREERQWGTNPLDADTDGDGLYDDEEILDYDTNPLDVDTDVDGLWDGEEVVEWYTDPLHWDSDGDV
ncbi:MAG: hypothetical protein AAFU79_20100, partial [Myxococcota bacterium]